MRAWVDGRMVDSVEALTVAGAGGGGRTGDGLFESVKVVRGRPFALTRHLSRLAASAQALGLPEPDDREVRRGVAAVLEGHDLALGRIRITFTGGPGTTPCLTVTATAMAVVDGPVDVVTVGWPRDETGALAGHKATAYADDILALSHARAMGAGEAILANTAGNLCEGTTSNVFYVLDGELRTPSLGSGCLPGISRELVLEWYGAREIDEPVQVLSRAEEIFLVSTTRDVQGVHRCDDRVLEAPGPVTREVAAVWAKKERENLDP